MNDKEKLLKLRKMADAMYYAAQQLTTDASRLHKAMNEYHQFIIHECKEELVNNDFEMALAEMIDKAQTSVVEPLVIAAQWKDELIKLAKSEEPVSEDLKEAANDYAVTVYNNYLDNPKAFENKDADTLNEDAFKAGAKWQKTKDESTTEDLGEYINELSKQFPEVSFAKLSRIAVRVAKWQKQKDKSKVLTEEQCRKICNDAFELGKDAMKQQIMKDAVEVKVKVDAGGYPYVDRVIELYDYDKDVPFAKEGDKYKVILIKED